MLHTLPQEIVECIFYNSIPQKQQREECLKALRLTCKFYRYWVDTKYFLKFVLKVEVDRSKLFFHNDSIGSSHKRSSSLSSTNNNNNTNGNKNMSNSNSNSNSNSYNNNSGHHRNPSKEIEQSHSSCITLSELESFLRRKSLKTLPIYVLYQLRIEGGSHLTAEDFSTLACVFHLLKQRCINLFHLILYSFNNHYCPQPPITTTLTPAISNNNSSNNNGNTVIPSSIAQFYDDIYDPFSYYNRIKGEEESWTTDDLIKYLPPNVQALSLYNCSDLTDFGLNELKHAIPKLRQLDIRYCNQKLTDEGMKDLPDHLEELTLFNYSNLTEKGTYY